MTFEPSAVRRILVIKLRHIGDVLLTVPVFRALRDHFPGAHLAAFVTGGTEAMLQGHPAVDDIFVFDRAAMGRGPLGRLRQEWRLLQTLRARRFDLTIDLTSGDRAAIAARVSGARYRLAFLRRDGMWGKRLLWTHTAPGPSDDRHTVMQNLELLEAFGIAAKDPRLELYWSPEDDAAVDRWWAEWGWAPGQPVVQVHPTSRWLFKCWGDDDNAWIIDALQARGIRVIVTCGPQASEVSKANRILDRCRQRPPALLGRTTLKQLAALTARCTAFFGVDSAPMHMAAAVGTPVVALFWSGSVTHWRPWGDGHTVIEAPTPATAAGAERRNQIMAALATIPRDRVLRALEATLAEPARKAL